MGNNTIERAINTANTAKQVYDAQSRDPRSGPRRANPKVEARVAELKRARELYGQPGQEARKKEYLAQVSVLRDEFKESEAAVIRGEHRVEELRKNIGDLEELKKGLTAGEVPPRFQAVNRRTLGE
jgi:hypothetical protein